MWKYVVRHIDAYNAEPDESYYFEDESVIDKSIIASCKMDFQCYFAANGRIKLK